MHQKNVSRKIRFRIGILLLTGTVFLLPGQTTVVVNPALRYQTTEGWGTSLCWFGNVIGQWSDANRDAIADLLFDTEAGLGINLVRYNIGGGDDPSHNHMGYGKEMPGYKTSAYASYDWNADPGQRWMLQAAKARINSEHFIAEAFSNSPPYWMTVSGCASGGDGTNLRGDYFDDFAAYLTDVVLHFRDDWGVSFRTLEPMNEPSLGWGAFGGQEGCHIQRDLQDDLIREVASALRSRGLATGIAAPDETNIDESYASYASYDSLTRSYLTQVNTHVYSGSNRSGLRDLVRGDGKRLWQSECDGSGAPNPFDKWTHNHNDITPALDISMRINRDMREMQPDGWIFWQAVESEQAQTNLDKNWGLIHADFEYGTETYHMTKKYYAMAQYTKFIRPGDIMIDINNSDAVAFINPRTETITIVQRNAISSDLSITYNLRGFTPEGTASVYRTSAGENFQHQPGISLNGERLATTARGQSITTYIIPGSFTGSAAGEIISVNDNTTGTGLNQFAYTGSWDYSSQGGAYQSDNHWNSDTNEYYQVRFAGIQIEIYGAIAPNHGIAAVSIDGGSETRVDYYSAERVEQALVYTSPLLPPGLHTLNVRVTGSRNSQSSGASIVADMVRIMLPGSATPTPPPTPTPEPGLTGDVNGDNKVNIVDALMTAQHSVGATPAGFHAAAADVNRDGKVTIIDALMIAQHSVGLIPLP